MSVCLSVCLSAYNHHGGGGGGTSGPENKYKLKIACVTKF